MALGLPVPLATVAPCMKPPVQLYDVGVPLHDALTLTAVPAAPVAGDTTTEHAGAVAPPPPVGGGVVDGTQVIVVPVTTTSPSAGTVVPARSVPAADAGSVKR